MTRRHDLVILGGGTAGLTAAIGAAWLGARVALVERDRTGGECLWTGCVPSKSLIAAARRAHLMRTAHEVGLDPVETAPDLRRVMARVRDVQARVAPHDSPERLEREGVEVIQGTARFLAPGRIGVDGRQLTYRSALIATGSRPVVPPMPGMDDVPIVTSETVWGLEELPQRLVVLGGGTVGCELGQAFARLGSAVVVVEAAGQLLPGEDRAACALLAGELEREGMDIRLRTRGVRVTRDGDGGRLAVVAADGREAAIGFDLLLVAAGRRVVTAELGLEAVGVRRREDATVVTDTRLRTTGANIYAAGDVRGGPPFTHAAAAEAQVAVGNALLRLRRRVDERTVPWVTFTDPEVARVGVTADHARERLGEGAVVERFALADIDRAACEHRHTGSVQLVADRRRRLIGATVVAPHAGEVIAELVAWMRSGAALKEVAGAVHAYPTYALGVQRAAGQHLAAGWLNDRTRRVIRPLLALLRLIDRPR